MVHTGLTLKHPQSINRCHAAYLSRNLLKGGFTLGTRLTRSPAVSRYFISSAATAPSLFEPSFRAPPSWRKLITFFTDLVGASWLALSCRWDNRKSSVPGTTLAKFSQYSGLADQLCLSDSLYAFNLVINRPSNSFLKGSLSFRKVPLSTSSDLLIFALSSSSRSFSIREISSCINSRTLAFKSLNLLSNKASSDDEDHLENARYPKNFHG